MTTWYIGRVAEEKTYQEQVNDGWFIYNQTVSDRWHWNTDTPTKVSGTIRINDSSSWGDLYNLLAGRLANEKTKVAEGPTRRTGAERAASGHTYRLKSTIFVTRATYNQTKLHTFAPY